MNDDEWIGSKLNARTDDKVIDCDMDHVYCQNIDLLPLLPHEYLHSKAHHRAQFQQVLLVYFTHKKELVRSNETGLIVTKLVHTQGFEFNPLFNLSIFSMYTKWF